MNDEKNMLKTEKRGFPMLIAQDELWIPDAPAAIGEPLPADTAVGLNLVSLPYIGAALRRTWRLWCGLALLGVIVGAGYYKAAPPSYQASTSILLTNNPQTDPAEAMDNNKAMAESQPVAGLALRRLGLNESTGSFQKTYTATSVTAEILQMNVSATTSAEAVRRAGALATAFLDFRASLLQSQQQSVMAGLDDQISQAERHVTSLADQLSAAKSQYPQDNAKLSRLQNERTQAETALTTLQQTVSGTQATSQATMQSMLKGSRVLNAAAPVAHSRLKLALVYVVAGLIIGLVLGTVVVVIRALVTDKLRRRDDIAQALGAPVRLSVGPLAPKGRGIAIRREGRDPERDLRRVVTQLCRWIPGSSSGPAGLALVAVDNAPTVARVLVELAVSEASTGRRVVIADLSPGGDAARLLGTAESGVTTVTSGGTRLTLLVPPADDVAPLGPLRTSASMRGHAYDTSYVDASHAGAFADADVVLSVLSLEPAFGGEHLATWARTAVVLVTAGVSSAARIHGVGELVRLGKVTLAGAVLIGADKADESLGHEGGAPLAGATRSRTGDAS